MTRDLLRHARRFGLLSAIALLASAPDTRGGDWPQWRGPNRDAHATDFKAPKEWPKELKQQWKVTVGDGVATPALVGGKLFVFSREGGAEVTRCLNADTGKELWKDKYDVNFQGKADNGFPGPRASPAVADGRVVTFGVNGTLSCLKADSGEKVWRVETGNFPRFHTSCSPVIADKLAIVQIGSDSSGGVTAYDLESGAVKWKWTDEGASYASPVLMTAGGTKMVVAETSASVVGLGVADGKTKWKTPFPLSGKGGGNYNASTPMVDGETLIFSGSGRGTRAFKVEKSGDSFALKELWANKDNSVVYNSPVLKNGFVYGQTSRDELFCVNAETGKTAWTYMISGRGYGNIVDAGTVLFSLTPAGKLLVFEPTDKEYKELAHYTVGASTYAYPIATGNRIYVKDKDSVILWTVE
ncbi:MAG: PQQ-like beta-propeller repeat protein [Planctomycetes bacterium]|nr:PQQ-like beta-propeller repeat protein [Planctomycetota bacterium]